MRRAGEVLEASTAEGRAAFIGYLPAGFPTVTKAVDACKAVVDSGADIIELGLPYTDPSLDGSLIQQASARALAGGVRTPDVLSTVEQIAAYAPHVAVLVMTYWNPVLRYGPERFAVDLASAGGAGLVTADITPDYGQEWIEAADARDLDKIFLVAQSSTPERLALTVQACRGFVYAAAVMGVTGVRASLDTAARVLVERTRESADQFGGEKHVCVGLGVSTPEQAREVAGYADGVIVGSALVRSLGDDGTDLIALRTTTEALVAGVRAGR